MTLYSLDHKSEDELRALMLLFKEMTSNPQVTYPICISCEGDKVIIHTAGELKAFRLGFILSRMGAFERARQEPWLFAKP